MGFNKNIYFTIMVIVFYAVQLLLILLIWNEYREKIQRFIACINSQAIHLYTMGGYSLVILVMAVGILACIGFSIISAILWSIVIVLPMPLFVNRAQSESLMPDFIHKFMYSRRSIYPLIWPLSKKLEAMYLRISYRSLNLVYGKSSGDSL